MRIDHDLLIDCLGESRFEKLRQMSYRDFRAAKADLGNAPALVCRAVYICSQVAQARFLAYPEIRKPGPSLVPRRIVQYWDREPADDVLAVMSSWKSNLYSDFDYRRFDDDSARSFLLENYGAETLSLYDYSHHPAMKSDIFRIAYLYKNGGIYIDADDESTGLQLLNDLELTAQIGVAPLFWDSRAGQLIVPRDRVAHAAMRNNIVIYLNNAPICAAPNNDFLAFLLENILQNVREAKANSRKVDIHEETGPGVMTASFVLHVIRNGYGDQSKDWVRMLCNWDLAIDRKWLAYKAGSGHWSRA